MFSFWFVGGRESQHCGRELHSVSRGPPEEITRIKLERQNSLISFDQKITLVLSRTWFAFLPIHSSQTEILAFSRTVYIYIVAICFCQFVLRKLKYLPSPVLYVLFLCVFANSFFGNSNTCLLRYCMTVPKCFCQFILRKLKYLPSPVLYVLLLSVFAKSFFGN